jgi:metallo-beta-lactamase class B
MEPTALSIRRAAKHSGAAAHRQFVGPIQSGIPTQRTRVKTRQLTFWFACFLGAVLGAQTASSIQPDKAIACDSCEEWNTNREPFRVFGNTYYVGTAGLSSVLVTSENGHVLFDGALPQSAALIDQNIRSLGFRTQDIRFIAASHEHFDHVGGIAALQRASGAMVLASPAGARALRQGEPLADDPQYALANESTRYARIQKVRVVTNGEVLRVGPLTITAYLTPGHTSGSTTWTWRSCEGPRCLDVVYADSLNPVSAPEYKFTQHSGVVEAFRRSIATVRNLPCDVLLSVHPGFSQLNQKFIRLRQTPGSNPFIDAASCQAYADAAAQSLDRRVRDEQ